MVADLDRLLSAIEHSQTLRTNRVDGWEAAARLIGISVPTLKKRAKTDPRFPRPNHTTTFKRTDKKKSYLRPEWKLSDLLNYKNQ